MFDRYGCSDMFRCRWWTGRGRVWGSKSPSPRSVFVSSFHHSHFGRGRSHRRVGGSGTARGFRSRDVVRRFLVEGHRATVGEFSGDGTLPPFRAISLKSGSGDWQDWLGLAVGLREGSQGPRISARIQVGGDFGTGLPVRWLDLTTCQWWAGWGSPVDRHPCAGVEWVASPSARPFWS